MRLKAFFNKLWSDDHGQSTTEYILMLSVVVMVAMKFKEAFLGRMTRIVEKVGGNIESAATME